MLALSFSICASQPPRAYPVEQRNAEERSENRHDHLHVRGVRDAQQVEQRSLVQQAELRAPAGNLALLLALLDRLGERVAVVLVVCGDVSAQSSYS